MFGETLPPQFYLPLTSHQRTRNMYIFLIFRGHYPLSHQTTSPPFQSPHLLPNNLPLQRKQLRLRAQTTCKPLLMDPPPTVWRMEEPKWSSKGNTLIHSLHAPTRTFSSSFRPRKLPSLVSSRMTAGSQPSSSQTASHFYPHYYRLIPSVPQHFNCGLLSN